ncbi:hypothetical protein MTR67_048031 [Solanum verrucosum]|uniref:Uncharacterized protein n=1 Tax=Solanum verrucosum TaxID=315347 RepID=A0AAF0ZWZ8_SOLVR|nr:hypothetical protein MTR67_048031 [Solanum verrucosum]
MKKKIMKQIGIRPHLRRRPLWYQG